MVQEAFDYITTGAASAGVVLAARLSEDASPRVLLLQAGSKNRLFRIHLQTVLRQKHGTPVVHVLPGVGKTGRAICKSARLSTCTSAPTPTICTVRSVVCDWGPPHCLAGLKPVCGILQDFGRNNGTSLFNPPGVCHMGLNAAQGAVSAR